MLQVEIEFCKPHLIITLSSDLTNQCRSVSSWVIETEVLCSLKGGRCPVAIWLSVAAFEACSFMFPKITTNIPDLKRELSGFPRFLIIFPFIRCSHESLPKFSFHGWIEGESAGTALWLRQLWGTRSSVANVHSLFLNNQLISYLSNYVIQQITLKKKKTLESDMEIQMVFLPHTAV